MFATLDRMLTTTTAVDGETKLQAHVPRHFAEALETCVRDLQPDAALEVGMAYGVSSLSILGGGAKHLTSVDANQDTTYASLGVAAVADADMANCHTLVADFDYHGLPRLLAEGQRLQFGYIDGWHTFDYTLLDFFYIDKMLDVGGIVAFNDCAMEAVHRVIGFAKTHRAYVEIDVGLAASYTGRSKIDTARRRLQGRRHQDRYFRKTGASEPDWDFYSRF